MHTKSAKKRLRQSEQRRLRNRTTKAALKSLVKKVREAVKVGDFTQADAHAKTATKKFDLAAAKRIVHKNLAARAKSRMSHLIVAGKKKAAAAKPTA